MHLAQNECEVQRKEKAGRAYQRILKKEERGWIRESQGHSWTHLQ